MKREELLYTNKIYPSFTKFQVDEVCDTYEQRIKELESQLENVQASMYAENVDANMALIKANERIKELEAENARLKAQVPKWHSVADGDLPTRSDVFCVLFHTEDGKLIRSACYYFADDDGDSRFGEWEFDWVEKWCELPTAPTTTEESSATEKENG